MPVHVYGLLDARLDAIPIPSQPGLDGRAVRALAFGDRQLLLSDLEEATLVATPKRLREHDAVLRAAVASGASVIPARLGRLHADEAAIAAALGSHLTELEQAMALIRGRVEMSLLIAPSAAPHSSVGLDSGGKREDGAGRSHLLRLQRQLQGERNLRDAASELAGSLSASLGGMVVAERVVDDPAPPVLASRAHLVARDDVARYLMAVESAIRPEHGSLRVAVRGPGAAYSFAVLQSG